MKEVIERIAELISLSQQDACTECGHEIDNADPKEIAWHILALKYHCKECEESGKVYYPNESQCSTCKGTGGEPMLAILAEKQERPI